jgi:hypothetical protein
MLGNYLLRHADAIAEAIEERDRLRDVANWLLSGDTGLSSEYMVTLAAGLGGEYNHPYDKGDAGRCVRAIWRMPWVSSVLDKLAMNHKEWAEWVPWIKERALTSHPKKADDGE